MPGEGGGKQKFGADHAGTVLVFARCLASTNCAIYFRHDRADGVHLIVSLVRVYNCESSFQARVPALLDGQCQFVKFRGCKGLQLLHQRRAVGILFRLLRQLGEPVSDLGFGGSIRSEIDFVTGEQESALARFGILNRGEIAV